MSKIKKWLATIGISIASLFGYQVQRAPVIQTEPHVILDEVRPAATPIPTPIVMQTLRGVPQIKLESIAGATEGEKTFVRDSTEIANKILSDDDFFNAVLDEKDFTETNGLTNSQIWDLLAGTPCKLKVVIYDGSWRENYIWKTMGYEDERYPNTAFINRFYMSTKLIQASLEGHEGLGHGRGFHHYKVKETSIPYKLNAFIERIGQKMGYAL